MVGVGVNKVDSTPLARARAHGGRAESERVRRRTHRHPLRRISQVLVQREKEGEKKEGGVFFLELLCDGGKYYASH